MNIFFIMIFSLTVNESCAIRCYVCITMRMHFMISVKHVILNPHDPRSWYDICVVTEGKCSSVDDESQSCVAPFRHSAIFVHKRRKHSSPNLARRQVFTQEIIRIRLTPPAPALPPLLCLKRRSLKVSPEVALISLLSASSRRQLLSPSETVTFRISCTWLTALPFCLDNYAEVMISWLHVSALSDTVLLSFFTLLTAQHTLPLFA